MLFGVLRPRLELEATDHVEDGVLGEHHLEQRVLEQPVNHQESQKALLTKTEVKTSLSMLIQRSGTKI